MWCVPVLSGAVAAVVMFVRLFVPGPVGTANNGDAFRLLCQLGTDPDSPPASTEKWYFVRFWYPVTPVHGCTDYASSEILPLRATAWIHKHILGMSGVIDLREMALEYCILAGLLIVALAVILRSVRLPVRLVVLCALFLVLSEATFADYAASPYSETAALWGLLVTATASVAVVAGTRYSRAAYLVAWAGALFAVAAKDETVTLAIPLALLLGTRRFALGKLTRQLTATWRHHVAERIVPALCVCSLALAAGWVLSNESVSDAQINFGNEVTMTIMPMVPNPDSVATGLGLPASFGEYSGTNWWSQKPIENDPLFTRYESKFTDANLARFFAHNPVLASRVFAGGADSYLGYRPDYLGSYPANAHYAPQQQECRDCVLQRVSNELKWTGFPGVLAYWLVCIGAAIWLIRASATQSLRRGFGYSALTLVGVTLVQYATAVFGEGNEVTKHMAVGIFTASLAPVMLIAGAVVDRHRRAAADGPIPPPIPHQAVPDPAAATMPGPAGQPG